MLNRGARANVRDDRYGKGALSLVRWNPKEIVLLVQHGAEPLAALHAGSPHFKETLSRFAYAFPLSRLLARVCLL